MKNRFFYEELDSTNTCLAKMLKKNPLLPEGLLIQTDFQTGGRGQGNNRWESEVGKNLLFSILLRPDIPASEQFLVSQAVALALADTLCQFMPSVDVQIKWPNDIYANGCKIAGILIENTLISDMVSASVVGIGLNVNQTVFVSDAPNPVSIKQLISCDIDRDAVLECFLDKIIDVPFSQKMANSQKIRADYLGRLYRSDGFYFYSSGDKRFKAVIETVLPSGHLVLRCETGEQHYFAFKEVTFCQ